jgi:CBS domain-containing protein
MSPQVVVAKENTNAEQISSRLLAGEFNGVPVVDDNGAVVGIVTALDILKAIQGGKKKLNEMLARDIMTPNPSVVKKDTPIEEIIRILVEKEIVLVPVVEGDNNNKLRICNNRKERGSFKDVKRYNIVLLLRLFIRTRSVACWRFS